MTALFSTVLQTSIYATIVGIVILITKHFLRDKLNAKWQYLIWSVLILKLLVPFGPESAVSLFNTVPEIPKTVSFSKAYEQVQLDITEKQLKASTITPELIAKSKSLSFAKTVEVAIPYIWGIGVILMLLWLFYTYYSMNQKLAKGSIAANERILTIFQNCKVKIGVSKDIEILIQDIVGSPSLFGIIHPKILLVLHVENFTDKEIEYILLHELAHYQRKDVLVNYLLLTMQLVHWFNPLMWYCFKCIRQDMEVATDEKVLLTLEKKEHVDYGKVLLMVLENISVTRLAPKLIGMVDDKKNMKRRIKMIKMSEFFKSKGRVVLVVG
ncbi:MAG: M56 family metallopeptidase, partial [Clostridiaceae bacterium]|nr:M56 family metallopeptidase [Clostridiaceae bacterium]